MTSGRLTPFARLKALPEVFDLADLRSSGLAPGAERNALTRWSDDRMVIPAGPRLGLYYNLVRDPRGADAHLGTVLGRIHERAVIIGACALKENGWTTQIPRLLTVAAPERRTMPRISGVQIYRRPDAWFEVVREDLERAGRGPFGLPMLSAPMALADALLHKDSLHHLAPDDIEIPEEVGADPVINACTWLGVGVDGYGPYLDASGIQPTLCFGSGRGVLPPSRGR